MSAAVPQLLCVARSLSLFGRYGPFYAFAPVCSDRGSMLRGSMNSHGGAQVYAKQAVVSDRFANPAFVLDSQV